MIDDLKKELINQKNANKNSSRRGVEIHPSKQKNQMNAIDLANLIKS